MAVRDPINFGVGPMMMSSCSTSAPATTSSTISIRAISLVGSTVTEHDVIDVQAYGFVDWAALEAAISDVSGSAVIQLSATNSITVTGVHTANLHQNDFII